MKKVLPILSLLIAIGLVTAGAGPVAAQQKLVVGKAVAATFGFLPADIGKDLGFFKKRGLDIEIVAFRGGAPLQQAMAAGSVDIGLDGATSPVQAIAQGAPMKIIGISRATLDGMVLIVGTKAGIASVKDLKGKKIGVTSHGAITDFLPRRLAEQQGWDPLKDVTRVALGPFTNQVAALKRGEIDGFVWSADGGWQMEKEGLGKVLLHFSEAIKEMDFEYFVVHDRMLTKPDVVRSFLEGWFETVRWMRANKEESVRRVTELLKMDPDVARRAYELDIKNLPESVTIRKEGPAFILAGLLKDKDIEKAPPVDAVIESRFVGVK